MVSDAKFYMFDDVFVANSSNLLGVARPPPQVWSPDQQATTVSTTLQCFADFNHWYYTV
jgi:hypothetical protein